MEFSAESVLDALNDFERKPSDIPPILDDYLLRIAQNGEIIFPWGKLKPLLKRKLELVLDEFYETCPVEISTPVPNFDGFNYDSLKKSILQAVDAFTSAPFTIQRICELVTNPKKHYNRTDKYMRGIEKNVLVVSTVEPRMGSQNDGNNANANPIVNGLINDSQREDDCFNGHENNENVSSSNMNTPANHVLLDNFANVFPSAACIPSASNICVNREIDNNFMLSSECVETLEVEFETLVKSETLKMLSEEEQMDISEEQPNLPVESNNEVTSAETTEADAASENSNEPVEENLPNTEEPASTEQPVSENSLSVQSDVTDSDNIQNEADCSDSSSEKSVPDKEPLDLNQCQQDDTVSQSDDNSHDSNEVSQSHEACNAEIACEEETLSENISEVTQSTKSDSSEQCMDLESSSSEEPSV